LCLSDNFLSKTPFYINSLQHSSEVSIVTPVCKNLRNIYGLFIRAPQTMLMAKIF